MTDGNTPGGYDVDQAVRPVAGAHVTSDEGEPVTQLSVVDADDCRVLFAIQR